MAIDQALLDYSWETGSPVFRVYQWNPFCISLGYHQKEDSLDLKMCRQEGVDVVRRPTGGRAVFHALEVTYAVVIPKQ
jgi:lipoate-protein ligase A